MTFLRKKVVLGVSLAAVLLLLVALVGGAALSGLGRDGLASTARASDGEDGGAAADAVSIKTVRPRHDPSFAASVTQPAFVTGYYTADLMAKVSGPVKSPNGITCDIGDRVKSGEDLVQIDVPDVEEDVRAKEAVVVQQQTALALARANVKTAKAAEQAAKDMIAVKQAGVGRAVAHQSFRLKELNRFKGLASGPNPAVTQDIIDERTEDYEAAVAGTEEARASVLDTVSEYKKAQAKSDAADADVKVAESLLGVARKDWDRAKALLSYATVQAPFDGVVTRRSVDPGTFVQKATTPLLTVVRDDIVTVYMKVPDKYAPQVNPNTEALIQMDTLPGVVIRGKVTRWDPSLETPEHDRTMRVEVDLYNGTLPEYQAFLAKERALGNRDLKSRTLPVFPEVKVRGQSASSLPLRLLPGMFGKMTLVLNSYQTAYLLPRSSVFTEGGTPYVFVVDNGKAVKRQVVVQADNGDEVKVALVDEVQGQEVRHDLTGNEEVVVSNQAELSDGQAVRISHEDW